MFSYRDQVCNRDRLLRKVKYLIFLFSRSGDEIKRGVEFRHSTSNASRIRRKARNVNVLMETEYLNARFPGSQCLWDPNFV